MSKEKLAEAIREEKMPNICFKHPRPCWYDGKECPACEAEKQFLALSGNVR